MSKHSLGLHRAELDRAVPPGLPADSGHFFLSLFALGGEARDELIMPRMKRIRQED